MRFPMLYYAIHLLAYLCVGKKNLENITISTIDSSDSQLLVYNEGKTQRAWNQANFAQRTCQGGNNIIEYSSKHSREFMITNNDDQPIIIESISSTSNNAVMMPSIQGEFPIKILQNERAQFIIQYNCEDLNLQTQDINGWDYIWIKIIGEPDLNIEFNYIKVCQLRDGYDPSIYLTLFIAIIVVAFCSRVKEGDTLFQEETQGAEEIKPSYAFYFVILASTILVIIFYLSEYLSTIFNILFSFSALSSVTLLFMIIIENLVGHPNFIYTEYQAPFVGKFKFYQSISFLLAAGVVLYWYITHNWLVSNIIGIGIVFLILRVVKLSSFKVGTILLVSLFFYDVFWVFYSTKFFGKSVMLTAATAIDIPNKIVIPYLLPYPISKCSLLGLGDMALPGLFTTFNFRFGEKKKTQIYYWVSIASYTIGMIACGIFLIIFKTGQPALLYIVPSLLIGTLMVSLKRGEFSEIWRGISMDADYTSMHSEIDNIQLANVNQSS